MSKKFMLGGAAGGRGPDHKASVVGSNPTPPIKKWYLTYEDLEELRQKIQAIPSLVKGKIDGPHGDLVEYAAVQMVLIEWTGKITRRDDGK